MIDSEANVPLKRKNSREGITLDYCNRHSRLRRNEGEDSTTFFFDYSTDMPNIESINWRELRKLKTGNKWGVIRHPYVLNYLNQKLIDCSLFYLLHIIAFFSFLLVLSWHIFARTPAKDWLVTLFVAVFGLFLILKGTIKARISHSISFWFVIAFCFNIITYLATLAYVWLPTIFKYDDYHQEVKNIVIWFLPIIAIISAWANFLYILRKSPFGIYIFMMTRILRSFGHIATIWIPTLIAFSFAFHLIMRDTGIKPWSTLDQDTANMTMLHKMLVILQAVTKTSTMMIGEVDANDILDTNQWIPSILVLTFEIITVILLMNLMVSLAVGDVNDLKHTAQDKLLKIKVNFVVEALQLSEQFGKSLHTQKTKNVLVVMEDATYFNAIDKFPTTEPGVISDEAFRVSFVESGMRLRIQTIQGRTKTAVLKNCFIEARESPESGIPVLSSDPEAKEYNNTNGLWDRFAKWIIGLDWKGFLDL
ncbi:unnamed protein product [Caenorhabditis angaria]|uniref:Ion transport domain-containing protein n=1 Tax=Caenorhabditis angaria TaxID=860376 RepID=A0A9P1MSV6_9PELO|nr:unnamed protein product [Caenorhabditis angaria]